MTLITTGDTHVDLDNGKRVCIHLNPQTGPSYAPKNNLFFRIGAIDGEKGITKIGIDNLETMSHYDPNVILKLLKTWLKQNGYEGAFRKVWGEYTKLKSGL